MERDELSGQKTRKIYAGNFLQQPVDFQANADNEFLKYGDDTLIVCPDVHFPGSRTSGVTMSCSLSGPTSEPQDELVPGCKMTASPFAEPCVRNCFKICGIESCCGEDNKGKRLKFGDTFYISPCVSSKPLFVAADSPGGLYAERGTFSGHPTLKLVDASDAYCRWTVTYWNAALRVEAEGLPIPNGIRMILKHAASNQNVTVDTDTRIPTFFGDEYEVSVHSHPYGRRRDKEQNVIWQFITGRLKSDDDADGTDE